MGIAPDRVAALRVRAGSGGIKSTVYVARQGDTYLSLSLRFYGDTNYKRLVDANPNVSNGPVIPAGTKILLPTR
jgi:phage tail protein X